MRLQRQIAPASAAAGPTACVERPPRWAAPMPDVMSMGGQVLVS